jgi:hypothetical protein
MHLWMSCLLLPPPARPRTHIWMRLVQPYHRAHFHRYAGLVPHVLSRCPLWVDLYLLWCMVAGQTHVLHFSYAYVVSKLATQLASGNAMHRNHVGYHSVSSANCQTMQHPTSHAPNMPPHFYRYCKTSATPQLRLTVTAGTDNSLQVRK